MVAPLPYPTGFIFKSLIKEYLSNLSNPGLDEYKIYLNDDQLFKGYTSSIYKETNGSNIKTDEIFDIQLFKEFDNEGNLLYWGWYGISTFNGAIDDVNLAKGIRLRKDNIQIGSKYTLMKLHKDKNRGNNYFFGEVHSSHPDLIPNSRRDYFSENKICHLFERKLSQYFHNTLHRVYYEASKLRSLNKDVQALADFEKTVNSKVSNGFTNLDEKKKLFDEFENKKKKAEEAKKKLTTIKQKSPEPETAFAKIFDRVVNTHNIKPSEIVLEEQKTTFITDKYSWMPKSERKLLSKIFAVIENVLSKDMAKNLIDKIDEDLQR
jgi:molecular chaperone HtpG